MWASWAELTKKSSIEETGGRFTLVTSLTIPGPHRRLRHTPACPPHCRYWLPRLAPWGGEVKGQLPEPQIITYKVINNNVSPSNETTPAVYKSLSFLGGAHSHPRGGRCGAGRHTTGREIEKYGTFPQDTQCSPQFFQTQL